jgi:hypothetical protein
LKAASAQVDIVSLRSGRSRGVNLHEPASRVSVDRTLGEAKAGDRDGLLVPGGFTNPDLLRLSRPPERSGRGPGRPWPRTCSLPRMKVGPVPVPGTPKPRVVVRASLQCRAHNRANRQRAQQLVWAWVRGKWPGLVPPAADLSRSRIEASAPGQALSVASDPDGADWTLSLAHTDARSGRTWMTTARVADSGEVDTLGVQISCTGSTEGGFSVAPPRLLGMWVQHLELSDGGFGVIGEPRFVEDLAAAEAFCNHVLSPERTLPIIALANSARSRYFGVDPGVLAEAVRGLAHVACLSAPLPDEVTERLGPELVPMRGAARLYGPHFDRGAAHENHPLIKPLRRMTDRPGEDPSSFRRVLVNRACALSAAA